METRIIDGEAWEVISKDEYEKDNATYCYRTEIELTNPDLFKMFAYTRKLGYVPNVTINGSRLTPKIVEKLVSVCGAVAVSLYDKDTCYNAVKQLTDAGMKQVNIHCMVSQETLYQCHEVQRDYIHDKRLEKMKAIIYLTLKQRGRGEQFTVVNKQDYMSMINHAIERGVSFGADSCSANKLMSFLGKEYQQSIEPCESNLFSAYIDVDGNYRPCSFSNDAPIPVIGTDFLKMWNSHPFRNRLLACNRNCPIYKV